MTIGLAIFMIWWAARHWFAIELHSFEIYGLIWIVIVIPVAFISLFLVFYTFGNNFPKYLKRTVFLLILLLANIPLFI